MLRPGVWPSNRGSRAPADAAERGPERLRVPERPEGWDAGSVLRMLREPRSGRPAPAVRLLAVLLVLGLLAVSAPVLLPAVQWVLDLL